MGRLTQWLRSWKRRLLRQNREAELEREIRDHLAIEAGEQETSGLTSEEAKYAALKSFGNPLAVKEDVRETWTLRWLDRLRQDLKYAVRTLLKTPAFTAMTVLTLAISIGGATAIFSQLNAVFWKLLPVNNPQELRAISWTSARRAFMGSSAAGAPGTASVERFSYPAYLSVRDGTKTFSDVACWQDPGENQPIVINQYGRVQGQLVSGNYFRMLGALPVLGRTITADDDRVGAATPVVVISHRLWQNAFNTDPGILNQTISMNGKAFIVIGVLPKEFFGLDAASSPDVIAPITTMVTNTILNNDRSWTTCQLAGRLKADVPDNQARAEIETLVQQSILANPPAEAYDPPRISLSNAGEGTDGLRQTLFRPLMILTAAVSTILLLSCANVAGLLLARGSSRQKEIATRLAIGAPRGRIIRQLLTESLLLSLAGGLLGTALAYAMVGLMHSMIRQLLPSAFGTVPEFGLNATPDLQVLSFAVMVSFASGLLFGLAPALRTTRIDLLSVLKQSGPNAKVRRFHFSSSGALITLQVALSMLLLIGAGLFIRTVMNLRTTPLGYDPEGILMFRVEPRLSGYTAPRRLEFFENTLKRFENIPGVTAASGSVIPLLANVNGAAQICVPGFQPQDPQDSIAGFSSVAPRYFETMRLPLLLGRDVTWSDRQGAPRVALVNEAFAKKYYAGRNPLGEQIGCEAKGNTTITVVGVVGDSKAVPRREARPTFYPAYLQQPNNSWMTFVVRSSGNPSELLPALRRVLNELDPNVPVLDAITPVELREKLMSREHLLTGLLVFFGALAMLLTCLGIYGMLSHIVTRRTSEIGLRMALGAARQDVVRMVVRESLTPVIVGIGLGWIAALALSRWLETMLFGVSKNDPWTIVGAALLFLAVASIAAAFPARRASRVDPLLALRHD